MTQKKDWKKPFALVLLLVILGAYYERLSVETQAMVLPMAIFIAAAIVIGRFKQLEYEIRSSKVNAREGVFQTFSIIDPNGKERVFLSAAPGTPLMTFFDEDHMPRATLELLDIEPVMKLVGDRGSAWIAFDENGLPRITLKDDTDQVVWSAPS
jgi:hypothetical protein